MDPVETNNEKVNTLKQDFVRIIKSIDKNLSLHDFRVVDGPTHTNLVFDVVIPHGFEMETKKLKRLVNEKACELNGRYRCVITVDNSYV